MLPAGTGPATVAGRASSSRTTAWNASRSIGVAGQGKVARTVPFRIR